ncbi:hypothetical protein KY289_001319 [Solanum tuberosum]|nr:hypothetical protein KY289_001319 [Solanum tuberosum]
MHKNFSPSTLFLNCVEPKFNSSRILNDFVEAKISTEGSAQFQISLHFTSLLRIIDVSSLRIQFQENKRIRILLQHFSFMRLHFSRVLLEVRKDEHVKTEKHKKRLWLSQPHDDALEAGYE